MRRRNPPGAGKWSLPGGRVRHGETLADAVEREVAEETGLEVGVGRFLGWVERLGEDPAPYHFVILDFLVEITDPTADPKPGSDATGAAWVPLADLAAYPLVDGLLAFLHDAGVLA